MSPRPPSPAPISAHPWRLWAGRITLLVLAPLIFFGTVEAGLRIAGYGDPTDFFQRMVDDSGKEITVENPYFGERFFRRHLPRTPAWNLFSLPNPAVPRIAIIGESAAQGYPLQKIGLASMLEGILEILYPGRRFEFINACMTSINSHVLAEIVPEILAQKPDLTILYMGNNEVVGPYGPGTPFTAWTRHRGLIWLDKKLFSLRSYQLMQDLIGRILPRPQLSWEGFQMFSGLRVAPSSRALRDTREAFRRNLEAMVSELLAARSKVILCTVAVNLADWGPSGTVPLAADSPAGPLLVEGKSLLAAGSHERAVEILRRAADAEPGSAEIFFYLGRAWHEGGYIEEARKAYGKARDLDEHRFRADSAINEIIRQTARKFADRGVVLVDAERDLVPEGIPGRGEFTEHVHLTFEGMQRLAMRVAGGLSPLIPGLGEPRPLSSVEEKELRDRLFFTPFDEVVLAAVARGIGEIEIFQTRPGAAETTEFWAARERELRRVHPLDANQLVTFYRQAVGVRPGDVRHEASLADYFFRMGRTQEAAQVGRRVLARKPTYFEGYRFLAEEAKAGEEWDRAGDLYRKALAIYRFLPDAHKNLGDLARRDGNLAGARRAYESAFSLDASNVGAALALAEIHAGQGNRRRAQATLETARDRNPKEAVVFQALGRLYAAEGENKAARQAYTQALLLNPEMSPWELLRFASDSLDTRQQKELFLAYEQRFGKEADLYNNFAWLLATSPEESVRDPARAIRLARRAVELSPEPNAHFYGTLAAAEASGGNFAEACRAIEEAIRILKKSSLPVDQQMRMYKFFKENKPFLDFGV